MTVDAGRDSMQNACMTNITIRNVPRDVHEVLVARANSAGQSLQQYLIATLEALSSTPTMAELVASIEQSELGSFDGSFAIWALSEERRE